MKPMVSIIVPVYNAEQTIGRCIDSILEQEYTNFELLLIDDGSKDLSGKICDEYAAKDNRIKVIHKENSGVSDSRNLALDLSAGKYLQFLDADDWITPNATKTFVEAAEETGAELIISNFYRVIEKRVSPKGSIDEEGLLSRTEFASHMMENPADFYYGVLWNKLYRRDIVEEKQLRMNKEISWCEDFMFNLEYIRHIHHCYVSQLPLYYYVKTKGSLASQGMSISKTIKMKLFVFDYYNDFYKDVLTEEDYEENKLHVYRYLVDAAGDGFVLPTLLPGSKKLGRERIRIEQELVEKDGLLMDFYRDRKLMDYYLEPISIRNNLDLTETKILWGLTHIYCAESSSILADSLGISRPIYISFLQRLVQKKLIKITKTKDPKQFLVTFTDEADSIIKELAEAESNFVNARLKGFTDEEILLYQELNEKIRHNIKSIL